MKTCCATDPELIALVQKGRDYSLEDQALLARKQREATRAGAADVPGIRVRKGKSKFRLLRSIIRFCP